MKEHDLEYHCIEHRFSRKLQMYDDDWFIRICDEDSYCLAVYTQKMQVTHVLNYKLVNFNDDASCIHPQIELDNLERHLVLDSPSQLDKPLTKVTNSYQLTEYFTNTQEDQDRRMIRVMQRRAKRQVDAKLILEVPFFMPMPWDLTCHEWVACLVGSNLSMLLGDILGGFKGAVSFDCTVPLFTQLDSSWPLHWIGYAQFPTTETVESTLPQTALGPALTLAQGQLEQHVENFAVVGGAALLIHGANIRTADADLPMTPQFLGAFEEAAKRDDHFTYIPRQPWDHTASLDIILPIDFLGKSGASGTLHSLLQGYNLYDELPVVTLIDLALTKGVAWARRGKAKDLIAPRYAAWEIVWKGMDLGGLDKQGRGRLDNILVALAQVGEGRKLSRVALLENACSRSSWSSLRPLRAPFNQPIFNFPSTKAAIDALDEIEINQLLNVYNLPATDDIAGDKLRFSRFIGITFPPMA
ncbi:hypothetical protein HOY82DRAFT_595776 [Tuber indicum]|nr:hypothetical protein HOY82DRAFT_595776 [Tuber indicum]